MSSRRFLVPATLAVAAALAAPSLAAAGERTLKPRFDTYVSAAKPSHNFARSSILQVGNHPRRRAFLRFRVRRLPSALASSALRLRVVAGTGTRIIVRRAGKRSGTITYRNAPRIGSKIASALVTQRGWLEIAIPRSFVRHHRVLRLALATSNAKTVKIASRNSGRPPKLVLKTASAPKTTSNMTYLDDGVVRVGINLDEGGTIQYFAPSSGGSSVINDYDLGRQVQQSYYAGPRPYGDPAAPWEQMPWNPIGTGDRYGHPSTILEWQNDGTTVYVKSRPKQWALDDVQCECVFEQWVTLDGNGVWVRNRLTNQRSDTTEYPAFTQELPAVYGTARLSRFVTYSGSDPFSGGALTEAGWSSSGVSFQATEHWVAMVDADGWGLGVVQPDLTQFHGRSFGTPGSADPGNFSTSYVAPITQEILDHDITYGYDYGLVLGTVNDIRSYAASHVQAAVGPDYRFDSSRKHWTYQNTTDAGWPISGALQVKLGQADPRMLGPLTLWSAAAAPKLYVSAAYHGTAAPKSQLYWRVAGDSTWKGGVKWNLVADDQFHTYELDLRGNPGYSGAITQLRFDPSDGSDPGGSLDVAYIGTTPAG